MKRMWINQPSMDQPFHHLHGVNVLADMGKVFESYYINPDHYRAKSVCVYFIEPEREFSMVIPILSLSDGWYGWK